MFNSKFSIYRSNSKSYVAIKVGWSHPAFFFGLIWCAYKRLYTPAIIIFSVSLFINIIFINHDQFSIISYVMNLCVAGFLGSSGNNLLVKQLIENGYIFVENTFAKNKEHAIEIFLKEHSDDF